jgi:glycoside hydrolase-like protein
MRHSAIIFLALLAIFAAVLALPGKPRPGPAPSSYLGFDLNEYPGDAALPILRKTFSFSSYWLSPPPGEKKNNWLGKRVLLQKQGFGFVVLFNGPESRRLRSPAQAKQKGIADGEIAAKLARQEGFPGGTIIFLDIEEGGRLAPGYYDYLHGWLDALARLQFRAGAYCSGVPINDGNGKTITTMKDIQERLPGAKLTMWVFNDVCPPAPGCAISQPAPPVAQSGFPEASVWQFAQSPRRKERTASCAATYHPDGNCYAPADTAHKWFLDLNVANSPNPSAP